MNVTLYVLPSWLWSGVNVKTPETGSKAMFGCSPEAVRVIVFPAELASDAEIVNVSAFPTVAVSPL